jgi:hypothetical protein
MRQPPTAVSAHHDELASQIGGRFDDHLGGSETAHHVGGDLEPRLFFGATFEVFAPSIVAGRYQLLEAVPVVLFDVRVLEDYDHVQQVNLRLKPPRELAGDVPRALRGIREIRGRENGPWYVGHRSLLQLGRTVSENSLA